MKLGRSALECLPHSLFLLLELPSLRPHITLFAEGTAVDRMVQLPLPVPTPAPTCRTHIIFSNWSCVRVSECVLRGWCLCECGSGAAGECLFSCMSCKWRMLAPQREVGGGGGQAERSKEERPVGFRGRD